LGWKNQGDTLRFFGRHEEAIVAYERAVDVDPRFAAAWCGVGYALLHLDWYEEAIWDFEHALAINPKDGTAERGRRIALEKQKRRENPRFSTPTLDRWGVDLNVKARKGKLFDAVGRNGEIDQVVVNLLRTEKSNPLLLGDAGVGKTAIVEALACRIVSGRVPPGLRGKRIIDLKMSTLPAGTKYRGEFEERVEQIIKEATEAPDVILFLDEIHTVVGAGSCDGNSNDAAQMLKPPLARGDFPCIGATTRDEYERFIRRDPALERRFSRITIQALTPAAVIAAVKRRLPRIIQRHAAYCRLEIDTAAVQAAVALTDEFVTDRQQPDKGIDAIDIACARAAVSGSRSGARGSQHVTAEDVAVVVSEWTGIPTAQIMAVLLCTPSSG
jgi:ATP-dependent Clp protease ATP-binding subunit ClpA